MPSKSKLFVKIGEACKELDIQPYVLRYWETEFPPLSPDKSKSGQRVYSEEDLAIIRRIKELLYEEGFTIAGAKKKLESELAAGGPKVRSVAVPAGKSAPAGKTEPKAPPAEEKTETPPPEPVVKPASKGRPKAAANKTAAKKPAAKKAAPKGPGTEAAPLRKAVEDALEEARAILTLLGE